MTCSKYLFNTSRVANTTLTWAGDGEEGHRDAPRAPRAYYLREGTSGAHRKQRPVKTGAWWCRWTMMVAVMKSEGRGEDGRSLGDFPGLGWARRRELYKVELERLRRNAQSTQWVPPLEQAGEDAWRQWGGAGRGWAPGLAGPSGLGM